MFKCYVEYGLLNTRVNLLRSENFGLGSLHDEYVGLVGANSQFNSVVPHKFQCHFVDDYLISYRKMGYFS